MVGAYEEIVLQSTKSIYFYHSAIERLKLSTRQYSKYQEKWLRMRLLQRVEEHSPDVYELDTTDLSSWHEAVEQRAEMIIDAFLKVCFSIYFPNIRRGSSLE